MQLSYWEIKSWFSDIDFTIVGSGIVGLNTALHLRKRFPSSKILILERSTLPQGASTKNAGFACVGSVSEILDDLKNLSEEDVFNLVKKRAEGLQLLRENIGDKKLDYQALGGYEVFLEEEKELSEECFQSIPKLNQLLKPYFQKDIFSVIESPFGFSKTEKNLIFNNFEGQIDTGKMMQALLKKAVENDVFILNNQELISYSEDSSSVKIKTSDFEFTSKNLLFTNNGFASTVVKNQVKPARAQVLITKPIENLSVKGTFHIEKGYYYFRNIDNRILLGGGRNLDFEGETTTEFAVTTKIQNKLEDLLKSVILPNTSFEIEYRWSGIMGVGDVKKPIVQQLSNRLFCGVRMGGMGVAIGSIVGKDLATLV